MLLIIYYYLKILSISFFGHDFLPSDTLLTLYKLEAVTPMRVSLSGQEGQMWTDKARL